eukprot:724207-Pelagomonas_calceolata.AAC.5
MKAIATTRVPCTLARPKGGPPARGAAPKCLPPSTPQPQRSTGSKGTGALTQMNYSKNSNLTNGPVANV